MQFHKHHFKQIKHLNVQNTIQSALIDLRCCEIRGNTLKIQIVFDCISKWCHVYNGVNFLLCQYRLFCRCHYLTLSILYSFTHIVQ